MSRRRQHRRVPTSRAPEAEERARACPGERPGPITPADESRLRTASSLRNRTAPAHVVLERLAASSDRPARALTMLGRVVKTIYIVIPSGTYHFAGATSDGAARLPS